MGPFKLVKNRMVHAHFPHPRSITFDSQLASVSNQSDQQTIETQNGLLVFAGGTSGNIIIPNWLYSDGIKDQLRKPFLEKSLKNGQNPTAYDFALQLSPEFLCEQKCYQPQLQCLMGCSEGNVYLFDPYLMGEGRITRFYHQKPPCLRKRRVDFVKWFEKEEDKLKHFLIVYDDGIFNVFDSSRELL